MLKLYIFEIQYLTFEKRCLEFKQCKGFTWHKDNHRVPNWSKACSLFSTYSYKGDGNSVSGLRECSGELNKSHDEMGGGGWWKPEFKNLVGVSASPTGIFFHGIEIKPKHQHKSEKALECIRLSDGPDFEAHICTKNDEIIEMF